MNKQESLKIINRQIEELTKQKTEIEIEIAEEEIKQNEALKEKQKVDLLPIKEAIDTFNKKYDDSLEIVRAKYVNTIFGKMKITDKDWNVINELL